MSAPKFLVIVTVERSPGDRVPAGVLEVRVIREVQAASYAVASEQVTENILDDLSRLMGGLVGSHIARVEVSAGPWNPAA